VHGEKEVLRHYASFCTAALDMAAHDVFDDAGYLDKLRALEAAGAHKHLLRYCGVDPRSPLGAARRLERRRLSAPDPLAKPQVA